MAGVTIKSKGAVLKGKGGQVTDDILEMANEEIGELAYEAIRQRLKGSLQNPTGYYESHIQVITDSQGIELNDGGVVYGPWLEGISPRNRQSTFKGYRTFGDVRSRFLPQAARAVQKVFAREMKRYG